MTELTGFLLARIAEDEVVAGAVSANTGYDSFSSRFMTAESDHRQEDSDFVDRYDPARVLAECAAKKAIVNQHSIRDCSEYEQGWGHFTFGCEVCDEFDGIVRARGYCPTLLAVASVYADHPDYQQEWALLV